MAELQEYRYVVNGMTITALLDEQDAKRLNAVPVTLDSAGASDVVTIAGKARTASNAARTPTNKGR
jgi:hypothetical protein